MHRKLRMGMVGGGRGAFIGAVHRMAACLDGQVELVCGAFSSDPKISRESGKDLFLSAERVYGSYVDLFAGNLKGLREKIPYCSGSVSWNSSISAAGYVRRRIAASASPRSPASAPCTRRSKSSKNCIFSSSFRRGSSCST